MYLQEQASSFGQKKATNTHPALKPQLFAFHYFLCSNGVENAPQSIVSKRFHSRKDFKKNKRSISKSRVQREFFLLPPKEKAEWKTEASDGCKWGQSRRRLG